MIRGIAILSSLGWLAAWSYALIAELGAIHIFLTSVNVGVSAVIAIRGDAR